VDGDGDLDLLYVEEQVDALSILFNQGGRTLSSVTAAPTFDSTFVRRFALGDFDHDGRLDVAMPSNWTTLTILRGLPAGRFAAGQVVMLPGGLSQPSDAYAVDFDGDGWSDLGVVGGGGDVAIFANRLGTFSAVPGRILKTSDVSFGDLDGDGRPDLTTLNAVYLGKGNGSFYPKRPTDIGPGILADLDGDGLIDVVSPGAGWIDAWHNQGGLQFDEVLQFRSVAVLGRSQQPVGGPEPGGGVHCPLYVLAGQRPGRLEDQALVRFDSECRSHGLAPTAANRNGSPGVCGGHHERVVDRRGLDPPIRQLFPAQFIDGDMAPSVVVGWGSMMEELRTLPRQVMVMEDSRSSGQCGSDHVPSALVERERAEVFHDHQISGRQCIRHLWERWPFDGIDGQSRHSCVDGTASSHRVGGEAKGFEGVAPFGGLDGHAVGATEAEREQGCGSDGVTVAAHSCGRPRAPVRSTVEVCPTSLRPTKPSPSTTSWQSAAGPSSR
jgi:hypothetical protein